MIKYLNAVLGRVLGPVSTFCLITYVSIKDMQLMSFFAVISALFMLSTAPLNQVTEHLLLKNKLEGKQTRTIPFLISILALFVISSCVLYVIDFNVIYCFLSPLFSVSHLIVKMSATVFRANDYKNTALWLDFSLRPFLIAGSIVLLSELYGTPSIDSLVQGYLIGATLPILLVFKKLNAEPRRISKTSSKASEKSIWTFLMIGSCVVITTQLEVFFSTRFFPNLVGELRVIQQFSSISGIMISFFLFDKLKDLYKFDVGSDPYIKAFKRVCAKSVLVSFLSSLVLLCVCFFYPFIWKEQVWACGALLCLFTMISSFFGPISSIFYKENKERVVLYSLIVMFVFKLLLLTTLANLTDIYTTSVWDLTIVLGLSLVVQNLFLYLHLNKSGIYEKNNW